MAEEGHERPKEPQEEVANELGECEAERRGEASLQALVEEGGGARVLLQDGEDAGVIEGRLVLQEEQLEY